MANEINGRLTMVSLAHLVSKDTGLSEAQVKEVIYSFLETTTLALTQGHSVAITNFGTWTPGGRKERVASLPGLEGEVLPAIPIVKFRSSPTLKAILAGGPAESVSLRKLYKGALNK